MPFLQRSFRQTAALLLGIGFLILLADGAGSLFLVQQTRAFADAVTELQEARISVQLTLSQLQDAETGQRGYLLTGDPAYLAPFTSAAAALPVTLRKLGGKLGRLSDGATLHAQLTGAANAKLAELQQTIMLVQQHRLDDAMQIVRTDQGKRLMDRARALIDVITDQTDTQRAHERKALYVRTEWLLAATWIGLLLILALGSIAAFIVGRSLRQTENARRAVIAANESLEQRVQERTEALASANEEIQRFAYIVSHDLRAPLVNVMGFTAELETALVTVRGLLTNATEQAPALVTEDMRLAVEEDLPEAVQFIRTSTQRMDRLINAILKLSREGRRNLTPERVKMADLFAGIGKSIQHQLDESDTEISVRTPMPDIVSDRLVMEQVFGNLIDNAVKYLQPGRPGKIIVTGLGSGPMLTYAVQDNGRGIEEKDRERVFELFRRAGVQDKPGEGIGLAHVRALVRRLGGTIDFTSTPGQGSIFTVRLPRTLKPETTA